MARRVYVFRDGKMVEVSSDYRSPVRRPNSGVIQDTMDKTWHPGDGRIYESKSAFRRATKALGLEEMGNDCPPPPEPRPVTDAGNIRADIMDSARKLRFME